MRHKKVYITDCCCSCKGVYWKKIVLESGQYKFQMKLFVRNGVKLKKITLTEEKSKQREIDAKKSWKTCIEKSYLLPVDEVCVMYTELKFTEKSEDTRLRTRWVGVVVLVYDFPWPKVSFLEGICFGKRSS